MRLRILCAHFQFGQTILHGIYPERVLVVVVVIVVGLGFCFVNSIISDIVGDR